MTNEPKYFLILEKRPGDYVNIDIALISDFLFNFNILSNIDAFTMEYYEGEIREMLRKTNIMPLDYIEEGTFYIIDNFKRKFPVLTLGMVENFNLQEILDTFISNKNVLNDIKNKYMKLSGNALKIFEFQKFITTEDSEGLYKLISSLEYEKFRTLIFYIINNVLVKEKVRVKELSKLD